MKKVLDVLLNPFTGLGVGGIFFIIGAVNSLIVGATSFNDLSWWGKEATIGFCVVFTMLFIKFFILPVSEWLLSLVKK